MNLRPISIGRTVLFVGLLFVASPASAQEAGRVGMVIGYPTTAGVHWQISDRFALRGHVTYSWFSSETTDSAADEPATTTTGGSTIIFGVPQLSSHAESSSHAGTIGIAALVTVHKTDDLRLYVAPKISLGITHASGSISTELVGSQEYLMYFSSLSDLLGDVSYSETTYSASYGGLFGGSTMINRRLGLFAEVGVVFSHSDQPFITTRGPAPVSSSKSVSTGGAVGVTVFF